ncbi:MAG: cytochrome c oxidase assembly protein, partial [Actinomycetospora chiangmaiensis]|nr:cytochrome c oxidase assembly protein [Actinomycetospora chiangmaiensis]
MPAHIPYCGSPPDPGALMAHWNLDPVLIAILLGLAAAYRAGAVRARLSPGERALFLAGWGVTGLALVSPLCPLSVALVSARVGQHMLIALVGAPLVVLGNPVRAFGTLIGWPAGSRRPGAVVSGLLFALALWVWHSPAPYTATFASDTVYCFMHVTLFGSALVLWQSLFAGGRDALIALGVGIGTSIQMGFLGAI